MPKLITPVQYEPVLEELNAVRPMQLQVRPRRTLNIPVLNKLPIESVKSIAGTLARCTQQGSLLNNNVQKLTQVEHKHYDKQMQTESWYITFSQRVYKVVMTHSCVFPTNYFRWVTYPDEHIIQELTIYGISQCNFVGTIMFVTIGHLGIGDSDIDAYGFY